MVEFEQLVRTRLTNYTIVVTISKLLDAQANIGKLT